MRPTNKPKNPGRVSSANSQPRGNHGRFIKLSTSLPPTPKSSSPTIKIYNSSRPLPKKDPPLVSFEVENPITYLKLWWKKVIAGEGIDIRFRIKPLTAIAIVAIIAAGGFGLGRFSLPASNPIVKYIPQPAPTPTPNPWRNTAFSGLLKQSGSRFYLVTSSAEAITLEVPINVNLVKYIGKRIFATGSLNTQTGILRVTDASDLEVLIQSSIIPTTFPLPTASPTPSPISPAPSL